MARSQGWTTAGSAALPGTVRHFYSVHPRVAHYIDVRGTDEYNPIWNILDLTPQGRGDFDASLDYGTTVQSPRR
jgi:predicted dithiol-disulfide oxidoreductase (DUF899 family)